MRKVISARDIEELIRNGGDTAAIPADALITPAARDLLKGLESGNGSLRGGTRPALASPGKEAGAAGTGSDLERLFHSPEIRELREQICDVGRRLWQRAYVDGNGGNISIRIGENLALCTPTLVSKGFMKPEDMCFVDLEGNQKFGRKKRTSEILMHLQIMKAQPKAKAVVHCHPPHATAFAVAGVKPPTCMIPEIEVFIGQVPIAPYETPGTPAMGAKVAELVDKHNTVLMANHGVVAWSHSVEDAYFKMEIIEAYCRTVVVASQLGTELKTFTPAHLQDLLKIKQTLDIPDPRIGLKECELCDNPEWRPGVHCAVPDGPSGGNGSIGDNGGGRGGGTKPEPEMEGVVQSITDEIMNRLKR